MHPGSMKIKKILFVCLLLSLIILGIEWLRDSPPPILKEGFVE
jgi:hypothetical protein